MKTYVAKIWNGCKLYMVCSQTPNNERYFPTKRDAIDYIRKNNNFTPLFKRVLFHQLRTL